MPFDAIIFDCDGTLVDSELLVMEVLVGCAGEHGVRMSVEEALERFKGGNLAQCVSAFEAIRGQSLPQSFVPDYRRRMAEALSTRLQPIEGAVELVESLQIPFCVASSGPREKIELSLSVTGLLPHFEGRIFSAYEINSWKPEPDLFLHAARALGATPARCAVVEDSMPGVQAGIAAGMTVFALADEAFRRALPSGVHAVSRLSELRKWLLK